MDTAGVSGVGHASARHLLAGGALVLIVDRFIVEEIAGGLGDWSLFAAPDSMRPSSCWRHPPD